MIESQTGKRGLILLALLALLGAGGYWFHQTFVWTEEALDLGYDKAARRDPWLAARLYLEKSGLKVQTERSLAILDALPPTEDALFLPRLPVYLSPERAENLDRWVREGGHLVTVYAHTSRSLAENAEKPFLERYGVRRETEPAEDDEEEPAEESEGQAKPDELWLDHLTEISFEGREESLHLDLSRDESAGDLRDEGGELVASGSNAWGEQILYYQPDEGELTVLSSADFLRNPSIAQFDHALFLTELLDGRKLWIVDAGDYPSLPALLWQRQRPAVIAAGLLLALLLWQAGGRFGPVLHERVLARRSLSEHLDAAGRYHWRADRGAALLARLRAEVEARATARHGAWPRLTEAHRVEWLAPLVRLDEAELLSALYAPTPKDELGFAERVRTLQTIRKSL